VIPSGTKAVARVLVSNILTRAIADLKVDFPSVTKEERLALGEAQKRLEAE